MSRDSGAGAYSHGTAWPSPSPQLDGERSPAGTRLVFVSVAMLAIMALGRGHAPERPRCLRASAAVGGDRVRLLAVADVQVVVVAGEPARQALADQHRVVEVDELDVARRCCPDRFDQRARRGTVVRGET